MSRRGTPTAAAGLSHELIVDAAITLIERDGADALSMRRVGAELGVEAMSLYHHIGSRDALLAAIGDRLLRPLEALDLRGPWRDACTRFAHALRSLAVARPATFRLVALRPLDTPASLDAVERLLATLVAGGFDVPSALAVYRAVASYARGYALAEATGFTVDAARAAGRAVLDALPERDFPILRGRTDELARLDAQRGFDLGLQALVAGTSPS